MPVRAVVFDIGGVLEDAPPTGVAERWEAALGLRPGELNERLGRVWEAGAIGAISEGTGSCTAASAGVRGWCESPWIDASGATTSGCSTYESEPSWQKSGLPAADTGCGSLRTVADVAADAAPATGIAVYDSGDGGWQAAGSPGTGGTSVAAALVAGIYALAGTPSASLNPAAYPYPHPAGLNDITAGSNTSGTCSPAYLCTAGAGYDGPTGLGSPADPAAFTPSGGLTGPLYNGIGNVCADDTGNAAGNGNKIQIWNCRGHPAQKWTVESDGTIRINGKCMDVTNGVNANGTKIQLYQCVSGNTNQQWRIQPIQPQANGPLIPGGELVNARTGRCLDNYDTSSTGYGTKNGTQLDIWACNGNLNQQWTLPYPEPGVSDRIISGYPSGSSTPFCVDDFHGGTSDGTIIDAWTCNDGATAQDWMIAANGTLMINGTCMDVYHQGVADQSKIQLYACNGGTNQQWRFLPDGSIVGLESGKCLDEDSKAIQGTQLVIVACHNPLNAAQTWTPTPYANNFP
jgi:hypothetical protein